MRACEREQDVRPLRPSRLENGLVLLRKRNDMVWVLTQQNSACFGPIVLDGTPLGRTSPGAFSGL